MTLQKLLMLFIYTMIGLSIVLCSMGNTSPIAMILLSEGISLPIIIYFLYDKIEGLQ